MQESFADLRDEVEQAAVLADDVCCRFLCFFQLRVFAHHDGHGIALGRISDGLQGLIIESYFAVVRLDDKVSIRILCDRIDGRLWQLDFG